MSVTTAQAPGARPCRSNDPDRGQPALHQPRAHSRIGSWSDPSSRRRWQGEFAEAVGPQLDRLHRLARRILRCDDLADDAVQEALISFWKAGGLPPNPSGWLTRAVVNRSLHLNRSRRRRRNHEERACAHRAGFDAEGEASRLLEAEELGVRIEAVLSTLPDQFREVFVLREVERMDYESIAGRLRVPIGTVRSRLSRSREALQKALGDCEHPAAAGTRRRAAALSP